MRGWPKDRLYLLATIGFVAAIVLTIVSWARLCSEACEEVHFYRFYGFLFEPLGLLFFTSAGLMHLFSRRYPELKFLIALMLAGALGSELNFIRVQAEVIGHWCPVCMTIAALVFYLSVLYGLILWFDLKEKGNPMELLKRILSFQLVVVIGFVVSYVGVFKPEKSFAEGIGDQANPAFGNLDSKTEVYVITDWFCPSCDKAEPVLAKTLPLVMKKAKVYFIDFPIHPETMNFVPYNLSFMLNNKQDYLKIRSALHALAKKTKTPTQDQVQAAVNKLGITYKPLNYSDVDSGIRFAQGIIKSFDVTMTPTVVITTRSNMEGKKLIGGEITEQSLLDAVRQ